MLPILLRRSFRYPLVSSPSLHELGYVRSKQPLVSDLAQRNEAIQPSSEISGTRHVRFRMSIADSTRIGVGCHSCWIELDGVRAPGRARPRTSYVPARVGGFSLHQGLAARDRGVCVVVDGATLRWIGKVTPRCSRSETSSRHGFESGKVGGCFSWSGTVLLQIARVELSIPAPFQAPPHPGPRFSHMASKSHQAIQSDLR